MKMIRSIITITFLCIGGATVIAAGEDYYALLGVSRNATSEELKRAYHKLALKWHPDKNENQEATVGKFQEVKAAFEILKDPQKRRDYDAKLTPTKAFPDYSSTNFHYGYSAASMGSEQKQQNRFSASKSARARFSSLLHLNHRFFSSFTAACIAYCVALYIKKLNHDYVKNEYTAYFADH